MLGFTWLVLWLGLTAPRAPWPEKLIGDPSYGIYIYAFPVTQSAVLWLGAGDPWSALRRQRPDDGDRCVRFVALHRTTRAALESRAAKSSNIEAQPIAAPATGT